MSISSSDDSAVLSDLLVDDDFEYSSEETPRNKLRDPFNDKIWVKKLQQLGNGFSYPQASFGDLNNEIHPVFRTLEDQPGFQPLLRLASKHLQEDCFLPFWHALLLGDYTYLSTESDAFGHPMYQISRKTKALTCTDISDTRKALITVADNIQFLAFGKTSGEEVGTYAETIPILPDDRQWGHLNNFAPGCGSLICFGLEFVQCLGPGSPLSVESKVRISFFLARVLLHELCHAFVLYRVPHRFHILDRIMTPEPFFEDQIFTEIGHANDVWMFGGATEILRNPLDIHSRFGLVVCKYPSWERDSGHIILVPKGMVKSLRKPIQTRWTTAYVLGMQFIQSQFMNKFWDAVKWKGPDAVKISKRPGDRFLGIRKKNPKWSPRREERWSQQDSSFERFADDDLFVLPGAVLSPNSPRFKHVAVRHPISPTNPLANGGGFKMGEVVTEYSEKERASIKYFDDDGELINKDARDYVDIQKENEGMGDDNHVAVPPVITKMVHWLDPSKNNLMTLDVRYHAYENSE